MSQPTAATGLASRRRITSIWGGVIIVLAIAAVYSNSLSGPLVFDDIPAIVENPTIRNWRTAFFPPADRGLPVTGRPVVNASLAINYAWVEFDPRGYHVVNIGLHAFVALLLFAVVRRTLERRSALSGATVHPHGLALAAALLWAVHPLTTAAVTYTIQRAEVLVSLFYLLTIYAFVRAMENEKSAPDQRGAGWLSFAVVACALGMATKEVMVSAPLIVFLYDRAFFAGSFRRAWQVRRGFYSALAATWLILAALMMQTGSRAGTAGFALGISAWDYALKQCEAIVHYLRLAVWPHPLVFDYGGMVLVERASEVVPQALLLVGLLGATLWALWRRPAMGFLGACFFALLAPTSSIVPLADTMFEHRVYLALGAVVVLAVVGLGSRVGRWGVPMALVLAVLGGIMTWQRNADYQTELTLWQDTVAKQPSSVRAHYTLGTLLFAAGKPEEAIARYRTALELDPHSPEAHNNFGNALVRLDRVAEAVPHYERALRRRPSAETSNNLGNALLRLGQPEAARERYEEALRLRPDFADAHNNLGNLLAQAGEFSRAARHYEAALHARPDLADAHANLGNALAQSGQPAAAEPHYEAALRLRPDFADAHFNFATMLAEERRWPEAIAHYEKVLQLRPSYPRAKDNLEIARIQQEFSRR